MNGPLGLARMSRRTLLSMLALYALGATPALAQTTVDDRGMHAEAAIDTVEIGPSTRRLKATLTITAPADRSYRTMIAAWSPTFKRFYNGRAIHQGTTLNYVGQEPIDGPALNLGGGGGGGGGGGCTWGELEPSRGGDSESSSQTLAIPAGATVRIVSVWDVSGDAPWVGADYSPRFTFVAPTKKSHEPNSYKVPRGSIAPRRDTTLQPPNPLVTAPLAARIDMGTEPRLKWRPFLGIFGPVAYGKRVDIVGSVTPPRGGLTVRLGYRDFFKSSPVHPIISVTTSADGKFRLARWKPRRPGYYAVVAAYDGQADSDLLPDGGCGMGIRFAAKPKRGGSR